MPHLAMVSFGAAHLECDDLGAAFVIDHVGHNAGFGHGRRAKSGLAILAHQKHPVECERLAGLNVQSLNDQSFSGCHAILFTACLDYCVHINHPKRAGNRPDPQHRVNAHFNPPIKSVQELAKTAAQARIGCVKTVAVLGASANRNKYGNKAVRAYQRLGYEVYPINLNEHTIEGVRCYTSVRDLPVVPDKLLVYLPPETVLHLMPEIVEKGCGEFWLNPGTESDAVLFDAEKFGLNCIQGCSIVAAGFTEMDF